MAPGRCRLQPPLQVNQEAWLDSHRAMVLQTVASIASDNGFTEEKSPLANRTDVGERILAVFRCNIQPGSFVQLIVVEQHSRRMVFELRDFPQFDSLQSKTIRTSLVQRLQEQFPEATIK